MKSINFILLSCIATLFILSGCVNPKKETVQEYKTDQAYTLKNVKYGSDNQQVMDIYLPAGRSLDSTKVFVLIHGGGWNAGDKQDFSYMFDNMQLVYPNHAIININYRLGSPQKPGYPMQLNDIKAALTFVKQAKFNVSNQFLLMGASAGGHLSLLYSYKSDELHEVKAICNIVGPVDFTDPAYVDGTNPVTQYFLANLVGPITFQDNPTLYQEVSPAFNVHSNCPPTISFYGDSDPLIPSSQMNRLHDKLDQMGVYNEKTMYAGEGHGNWNSTNNQDFSLKLVTFINQFFK
ncbi:MAG: alpha/beta hydrolase [Brumimicrobium sp.]|nr:alpha/beta hydrolase [Brumimicrobium sp.]